MGKRNSSKSDLHSLSNISNYKLNTLKQMAYLKSRINSKTRDLEPSRTYNDVLRASSSKDSLMKGTPGFQELKVKKYESQAVPERPTTTLAGLPNNLQKIDEFPLRRPLLKS